MLEIILPVIVGFIAVFISVGLLYFGTRGRKGICCGDVLNCDVECDLKDKKIKKPQDP